jgi:hypothetical protein
LRSRVQLESKVGLSPILNIVVNDQIYLSEVLASDKMAWVEHMQETEVAAIWPCLRVDQRASRTALTGYTLSSQLRL